MDFTKISALQLCTLCLVLPLLATSAAAANSGKYTDENRPYEFSFNIEGEQHRKESKDENGIIMGEFGFITADGVYHITVYATDENGNFKILSMKNIRLGASPTKSTTVAPPTTTTTKTTTTTTTTTTPAPPLPPPTTAPPKSQKLVFTTLKPLPVASCAFCSIPSTTKRPPPPNQIPQNNKPSSPLAAILLPNQNQPGGHPLNPQQPNSGQQTPFNNLQKPAINNPQTPNYSPQSPSNNPQSPSNSPHSPFGKPQASYDPDDELPQSDQPIQDQPAPELQAIDKENYVKPSDQPSKKKKAPVVISGSMHYTDPSALNNKLRPGEKEGLPDSITEDDVMEVLYRFNYTLGFHGHYEEGYRNGDKKGEYYVKNRNGWATKVSYIANDKGFQPKVETVKLIFEETPLEETEKELNTLKGYEFKWFYVPKNHYLNNQK